MTIQFGKKQECAVCGAVCFVAHMHSQRGSLVCAACYDRS